MVVVEEERKLNKIKLILRVLRQVALRRATGDRISWPLTASLRPEEPAWHTVLRATEGGTRGNWLSEVGRRRRRRK